MSKLTLKSTPSGHDGNAYVTIGGRRLLAFYVAKLDTTDEMVVESKRFVGERRTQHAVRGVIGKGNVSYYNTTKALNEAVTLYETTGEFPEITIQAYVDSPGFGRNEYIFEGVIPESIQDIWADDSSDEATVHPMAFTYDKKIAVSTFKEA